MQVAINYSLTESYVQQLCFNLGSQRRVINLDNILYTAPRYVVIRLPLSCLFVMHCVWYFFLLQFLLFLLFFYLMFCRFVSTNKQATLSLVSPPRMWTSAMEDLCCGLANCQQLLWLSQEQLTGRAFLIYVKSHAKYNPLVRKPEPVCLYLSLLLL